MIFHNLAQLFSKTLGIQQIAETKTSTRDLVFVGWADTATGRTNSLFAAGDLARLVQRNMVIQNQGAGFAQSEALTYRHILFFQASHLFQQCIRRQHNTISDQATDPFA